MLGLSEFHHYWHRSVFHFHTFRRQCYCRWTHLLIRLITPSLTSSTPTCFHLLSRCLVIGCLGKSRCHHTTHKYPHSTLTLREQHHSKESSLVMICTSQGLSPFPLRPRFTYSPCDAIRGLCCSQIELLSERFTLQPAIPRIHHTQTHCSQHTQNGDYEGHNSLWEAVREPG